MVDNTNFHETSIILNQTNALNLTPYCNERKLLTQGVLWHKIIIHNVANEDREIVLKNILSTVHPLDLIPVNYKIEGNNAHFIARNCGPAIEKLCRDNLIVHNKLGQSYILTVIIGFSNTTETKLNVQINILEAIKKRHDIKTGTIDLESFHKDPVLGDAIFCILSQPKVLFFVLQLCKTLQPKILKLGHNELTSASSFEILWSCKSLTCLDLKCNLFENMISLSSLKSMQIKELWLDGNPVCQHYDETGYLQAVREICPTVLKLDGVLLGTEGFLAYRRNYSISHNSESFVDQFLEHYFTLYDSVDRKCLQELYHKNAFFSLSCSYIADQTTSFTSKLDSYKGSSRNLLKLIDFSKTNDFIDVGPQKIIKKLCSLPATQHDPYTFTVDVIEFSDRRVTLTVTGAFREPALNLNDSEFMYCFCRTFVIVAGLNGEYNILNEMLHVSNITTILASRAFKIVKISKPRALTALNNAQSDPEKEEFLFCLSRITALKSDWSRRCLEDAKWDLRKALEIFVDFYKLDKIPQDAFLSTEALNKMMKIRMSQSSSSDISHEKPATQQSLKRDRDAHSRTSPLEPTSKSPVAPRPPLTPDLIKPSRKLNESTVDNSSSSNRCTTLPRLMTDDEPVSATYRKRILVPRDGGGMMWTTIKIPISEALHRRCRHKSRQTK